MTDASGTQIDTTMKYLPFGGTLSGSVPTDKLFTGQRLDSTGLYYYGARYYDPTIRRFISPDTIVPYPFNPQSFNRYSYCSNNPLKYIDPSGHRWVSDGDDSLDEREIQSVTSDIILLAAWVIGSDNTEPEIVEDYGGGWFWLATYSMGVANHILSAVNPNNQRNWVAIDFIWLEASITSYPDTDIMMCDFHIHSSGTSFTYQNVLLTTTQDEGLLPSRTTSEMTFINTIDNGLAYTTRNSSPYMPFVTTYTGIVSNISSINDLRRITISLDILPNPWEIGALNMINAPRSITFNLLTRGVTHR
jgi:RHS repeat-associated protein